MSSVPYVLYPNALTDEPNDHWACVISRGAADLDAVIDRMILQDGSIAVRAEVLSTLEDFFRAVEDLLVEAYTVCTPLATCRLSIRGKFAGAGDSFDPQRHQVVARASTGARLRRTVPPRVVPVKDSLGLYVPQPESYLDAGSGSENASLTALNIGMLTGRHLRFDPADEEQGIFFQPAEGEGETRAAAYSEVVPSTVHFLVPDLAVGAYKLVVRTRLNGEDHLYSGALKPTLTVS